MAWCYATPRAMGEFGAVSVVSGHIRGLTNTMPLHVEILYNEYNYAAAFARGLAAGIAGTGDTGGEKLYRMAERTLCGATAVDAME